MTLLIWDGLSAEQRPDEAVEVTLQPGQVWVMDDSYYAVGIRGEGAFRFLGNHG